MPPDVAADLSRMLDALGWPDALVDVLLCNDARIRELNAEWRGRDEVTDVLAFPQLRFESPAVAAAGEVHAGVPVHLGDVVISTETSARQAAAVGHPADTELRVLLAHALCHLLGHVHDDDARSEAMAVAERRALAACDLAGPGLVARVPGGR